MRDEGGSSGLGAADAGWHDADHVLETRDGEAFLLRCRMPLRQRCGKLTVMLLGGTSADMMLGGFVLNECDEVGRIETIADPANAAQRIAGGRHFDIVFLDADGGTDGLAETARMIAETGSSHTSALVLLASRFSDRHIDLSPPGGPFAARLAKPMTAAQCNALFRRLYA